MREKYNPKKIEKKWQKIWAKSGLYKTKDFSDKPKFYALDMFPYPSGAGLHVGHPKGFIATDVFSRFKIFQGFNVLHPMGWDAFGLPAENYAIKNKVHPRISTEKNVAVYKKQIEEFGFTYDWSREINTTDPEFYKWTQWVFLKMFEKGLAFQSDEPVNWCPSCKTVLANEDLEGGLCERCGTQVVQKKMKQWVLRMTAYADRLLYDLDTKNLDWEELIKEQQGNWIGRSEGVEVEFPIVIARSQQTTKQSRVYRTIHGIATPRLSGARNDGSIKVYTTRLDTIFGCTYCVVAPEHPIIEKLKDKIKNYKEKIEPYIIKAQNKTNMERTELQKEKTGERLEGLEVINPFTEEAVPLFMADYVLGSYGTGAVMAVPAHDERDFEFAKKYNLPIKKSIKPFFSIKFNYKFPLMDTDVHNKLSQYYKIEYNQEKNETILFGSKTKPFEDVKEKLGLSSFICDEVYRLLNENNDEYTPLIYDGILINSNEFTGLTSVKARVEMTKWLEEQGIGKKKVNYKMRDWVFSRQRYWGEPIPIIHCAKCGVVAVPEKDLPVKLPDVKSYEPTGTGESPLAKISEWVNVKCPKCGGAAKRETNTMPQWAGSSWYYLRYIDPKNKKALIDKKKEKYWMPVDLYVGGAEHATRHLLYARFWHKFLYDIGAVNTEEPFKKLFHVGLILAEDGRKMSKRWGNVVNPDDMIAEFGADSMRLFEMFMGPFSQAVAWSTKSVSGVRRFLERIWGLNYKLQITNYKQNPKPKTQIMPKTQNLMGLERLLNKTIKKVGEDIEEFKFNTAISALMILSNEFEKQENLPKEYFEKFLILLSPFAPHIAEELWERLGHKKSIFLESWPKFNPTLIKDETVNLVISINGKVRYKMEAKADISEEEAKTMALASEQIKKYVEGKTIRKVIFVKGRLLNIVV